MLTNTIDKEEDNLNLNTTTTDEEEYVSLSDKIQLKKDIRKLDKQSCITILQFILNHNVKFTDNTNGVFFNLKSLNNKQIKSLIKITNDCKNNMQDQPLNNVVETTLPISNNDNLHHSYKKYINNGDDL